MSLQKIEVQLIDFVNGLFNVTVNRNKYKNVGHALFKSASSAAFYDDDLLPPREEMVSKPIQLDRFSKVDFALILCFGCILFFMHKGNRLISQTNDYEAAELLVGSKNLVKSSGAHFAMLVPKTIEKVKIQPQIEVQTSTAIATGYEIDEYDQYFIENDYIIADNKVVINIQPK